MVQENPGWGAPKIHGELEKLGFDVSERTVARFQHDRIHDALAKDTPLRREVEKKPSRKATVSSSARLGGLHYRYGWRQAA